MPSAKRERQREGRESRRIAEAMAAKRRQRWRSVRNVVLIVVAIVVAIVVLSLRSGDSKSTVTAASSSGSESASSSSSAPPEFTYGTGPCPNADGSSPKTLDFTAAGAPQNCLDPSKTYTATLDTTIGTVKLQLDTDTTPGTANNFIVLARYHYYDGTLLFRTDQSIGIIQGGSPHSNNATDKGPGYALMDEGFDFATLGPGSTGGPYHYLPGDFVMARADAPNGAAAQFFFAVNDKTASLDKQGDYVKFGTTIEGLDALAFFLASEPNQQPVKQVTINTVTISES